MLIPVVIIQSNKYLYMWKLCLISYHIFMTILFLVLKIDTYNFDLGEGIFNHVLKKIVKKVLLSQNDTCLILF